MICNRTVRIRVKNFMYRVHQFPAISRNRRNIIPAAPYFLGRYPPTDTKIAENGGGVFLRCPPAADLLANILRLNTIHAVLQIKNQTVSGICLIQYRNFFRFFNQQTDTLKINLPVLAAKGIEKFIIDGFKKRHISFLFPLILCCIRLYQIAEKIASPELYNLWTSQNLNLRDDPPFSIKILKLFRCHILFIVNSQDPFDILFACPLDRKALFLQ